MKLASVASNNPNTANMSLEQSREPPQAPPVFTKSATAVLQDAQRLIDRSREVQRLIVENVEPGCAMFSNVLLPLAHVENAMALEMHILGFYRFVSTDPDLREASRQAHNLLNEFSVETAMNEDLFRLANAIVQRQEPLDAESLYLLKKKHKNQ